MHFTQSICEWLKWNNIVCAAIPGSVATDAETNKCRKYNDLLDNYYFHPVAIETTGVYGKSTAPFLSCLAKKLVDISGDPREWQWLSLGVVRGGTPPAYWPVCKFDLILATLSAY